MSITNTKEMLLKAYENNYAILHVNVINYDMARVSMLAAEEKNSPIIIAVSEKALKNFAGPKDFAEMVTNIDEHFKIKVPVAIHLDHGLYDTAIECINAGFTSVMFDGSKAPLNQNIKQTMEIIRLAKLRDITVEAEVGAVTGKVEDKGEKGELASVTECKMMADLGIDCLAAGIGNIHGQYPAGWPGLNFERLNEIDLAVGKPLALHGGSGIPEDQVKRAISLGIAKFNVGTELLTAFTNELAKHFVSGNYKKDQGFDPRNYFTQAFDAVKAVVIKKLQLVGSVDKAD